MAKKAVSPHVTLTRAVILEKEGKDYFQQAALRTGNDLARRTFQALAERHTRHAERIEQISRALEKNAPPEIEPPAAAHTLFEEIVRRIEQSTSPTAHDITELREAIVYSTKIRDVYAHLAQTVPEEWERSLYGGLQGEEEALKATLADTLNYLRSNFELSQLPKAEG